MDFLFPLGLGLIIMRSNLLNTIHDFIPYIYIYIIKVMQGPPPLQIKVFGSFWLLFKG